MRVGRVDGKFIINPTYTELESSELDLRMAGTRDAILMVEAGAKELSESAMVEALTAGHRAIQVLVDTQQQMAAEIGKAKRPYTSFALPQETKDTVAGRVAGSLSEILSRPYVKAERNAAIDELEKTAVQELSAGDETKTGELKAAFEDAYRTIVRQRILGQGSRLDGRSLTEVRQIWCEVDFSPRAHGSGLFTRGETQVLTLATLGTPRKRRSWTA